MRSSKTVLGIKVAEAPIWRGVEMPVPPVILARAASRVNRCFSSAGWDRAVRLDHIFVIEMAHES